MARLTASDREMYEAFCRRFTFCWACGWRWQECCDNIRYRLECAHIVGGPGRRHDRRAIVRLCTGCHLLAHGARVKFYGEYAPMLTIWNLTQLKQQFDPANYDPPYIQSLRTARAEPISTEPLPDWFDREFEKRHRAPRAVIAGTVS